MYTRPLVVMIEGGELTPVYLQKQAVDALSLLARVYNKKRVSNSCLAMY